jgi:hypothetical protein
MPLAGDTVEVSLSADGKELTAITAGGRSCIDR